MPTKSCTAPSTTTGTSWPATPATSNPSPRPRSASVQPASARSRGLVAHLIVPSTDRDKIFFEVNDTIPCVGVQLGLKDAPHRCAAHHDDEEADRHGCTPPQSPPTKIPGEFVSGLYWDLEQSAISLAPSRREARSTVVGEDQIDEKRPCDDGQPSAPPRHRHRLRQARISSVGNHQSTVVIRAAQRKAIEAFQRHGASWLRYRLGSSFVTKKFASKLQCHRRLWCCTCSFPINGRRYPKHVNPKAAKQCCSSHRPQHCAVVSVSEAELASMTQSTAAVGGGTSRQKRSLTELATFRWLTM